MSKNFCPQCDAIIEPASINIAQGIALCPNCGKLSSIVDISVRKRPTATILSKIPSGCSIIDLGDKIVVEVSLRSVGNSIRIIFMALFWNTILFMFLINALGGLYLNLVGPLPVWYPPPVMDGGKMMSLGEAVDLSIFLIPFGVIGIGFICGALVIVWGSIKVEMNDSEGKVVKGFGFLAWRQRFDPREVEQVAFDDSGGESATQSSYEIVIKADQTIAFGSMLQDRRKEWLEAMLRAIFMKHNEAPSASPLDRARQVIVTINSV
jgi:hypothetical protein